MNPDAIDALLRSLEPPGSLAGLELRGRIRRTGEMVMGPEGQLLPMFEIVQTKWESDRSWQ